MRTSSRGTGQGAPGLTYMDGPRARSGAGVQSHDGERDQAQQQRSHCHRGHRGKQEAMRRRDE